MNNTLCTFDKEHNAEVTLFVPNGYFLSDKPFNKKILPHTPFTKKIINKALSLLNNHSNDFNLKSVKINKEENCYVAIGVHKDGLSNGYLQLNFN